MSERRGPAGHVAELFVDSKLTPLLVIAALALGGLAIYLTPREEEPQIVVPMVDIFVGLPGADPAEVETRLTVPLEKRMWEIAGVEYVYATSMPGRALVTVRFRVGEDQERSLVNVYQKMLGGLDRMPSDATPPLVRLRTIDDVPVLALTLWSAHQGGFALRRLATELRRELARLDDVSEIGVHGGLRRQVRVLLDPERLAASGVDAAAVASGLRLQNAAAAAGTVSSRDREIRVETGAFLRRADDVANLVVGVHAGRPVRLRDVADVVDGPEEPASYVFFTAGATADRGSLEVGDSADDLLPAVTLAIAKRKGADAHQVVGRVLRKVEQLRGPLLPGDVQVSVTRDYGETAKQKADELLTHLLVAIVSVTLVIALALGWRGAVVVFVSVPVSFALTLFVYWAFGYTLNRVTLFALIFVTGIVVDDSIIVVENIVRHLSMSARPSLRAVIGAVDEVGTPTILATLTVIAAVLPMAFVRGLMGPYMRPMPVGASLAMIFSLLVAVVAAPWLSFRLLRGTAAGDAEESHGIETTRAHRVYRRILGPLLRRPVARWGFLAAVGVLLAASLSLLPLQLVTVKMLPFDNKSEVQVILDLPEGTTLEATAYAAADVAAWIRTLPEVTDIELYVGESAPINFNGLVRHYDLRAGSNVADLQVNLIDKHVRSEQSHAIAKRLRPTIAEIAGRHGAAAKVVEIPPGPPVLSTLVAEIYGPTQDSRLQLAERVRRLFESTDGVVDVDWFVEAAQLKKVLEVDHEKAQLHGVPAAAVARTLRLAVAGESAGLLHLGDEIEPVPIVLRLPIAERSSVRELADVQLLSATGALVPVSELVRVRPAVEDVSRHRKNLRPVIYVVGEVTGERESPVYAILEMSERLAELPPTDGAVVEQYWRDEPFSEERPALKWDGEWHITYEVFRDLGAAFAAVLVLIYLLIIGWFGSFRVPLVMMIAIPLALVGILPGHWLFGAFFTATSMIGFIALAGIMVRNSVLLIDFVELSTERGRTLDEAVLEAGSVRFRPILLTAGTVVVGATVILFDPIFEGLAISLMSGAIASTVLTLVVVPLVHFMVENKRRAPRSFADRGPDPSVDPEASAGTRADDGRGPVDGGATTGASS